MSFVSSSLGEGWLQNVRGPVSLAELVLWEVWVRQKKGGLLREKLESSEAILCIPSTVCIQMVCMMMERAWRAEFLPDKRWFMDSC